jgi:hypothetical protein
MTTYERTKCWRKKHPEVKASERLRYYRQFQKNKRRKGRRWTEEEDKKITARNKTARTASSAPSSEDQSKPFSNVVHR